MNKSVLIGEKVELCPLDTEKDSALFEKWNQDSDYMRQLDLDPAIIFSAALIKEWFEKEENDDPIFAIKLLDESRTIGDIGLYGLDWVNGNAWVGISIGDPACRGKGFGTEAMRLILAYAFNVLNLHRVTLDVFEFNPRAIRSYEKCGFKAEGVEKELIFKEDMRWNVLNMGILRNEWELLQASESQK